ncbi:MAG: hypothetical protein ACXAE3_13065 [Candidatus Kariarchaeaceae archaeon]|jgi:hypothetical protein
MGFPYPYPLGLPKGTVRASLTLSLSITLVLLTLSEEPIANQLATLVVVSLTFYFGGKMRAMSALPRLADPGTRAFGLPAGSVRFTLMSLFGGTFAYLYFVEQREFPVYLLEIGYIIGGYLLGKTFIRIRKLLARPKEGEEDKITIVDHLKSLAAISLTGVTIYFVFSAPRDELTSLWVLIASAVLGFYFSSREAKKKSTEEA